LPIIFNTNSQLSSVFFLCCALQILAIYDRFGRLAYGSEKLAKDCLEYVVFEKHLSDEYGSWRVHGKILPDWLPTQQPLLRTMKKPSDVALDSEPVEDSADAVTSKLADAWFSVPRYGITISHNVPTVTGFPIHMCAQNAWHGIPIEYLPDLWQCLQFYAIKCTCLMFCVLFIGKNCWVPRPRCIFTTCCYGVICNVGGLWSHTFRRSESVFTWRS